MAQTIVEGDPFSILDKVQTKNTDIRVVRNWEVGVSKTTIIKFNLPFDDDSKRLLPPGLRRGEDRYQEREEGRHLAFAEALGKNHKTVSFRQKGRPWDTADEKMETPRNGQASAGSFWEHLHGNGFQFVDGEYFQNIRRDGSIMLVVEIKFVHHSKKENFITALKAGGTRPTLLFNELRERLLRNLFRKNWHRCVAYSNSAHLEPSKTYNFTGAGIRGKTRFELSIDDRGRVTFIETNK